MTTYANMIGTGQGIGDTGTYLLDVVAFACLRVIVTDPTLATVVAAVPFSTLNTNSFRGGGRTRVATMNGNQMAAQIMLATEGTTTGFVLASKRLGSVGVMGCDVRLQVVGTSKSYKHNISNIV